MNLKNKLSRGQSTAIAAGLSVALIGGGVAVAQQINLPNQDVVPASAECLSVPADASPVAFGDANSPTWSENSPAQWGGEGLMPGGRVYRSYAVRNLDARPVKWTINLSSSTSSPNAYFALGAAVGPVTADAASVEPSAISYPAAPDAPIAETPADGFLWLIGSGVPTSLKPDERGDVIAEVIIPSGSYVAITDWVAAPPGYEWSSPDQRIDPVWATTAQPGTLDDAGNFTPADGTAPDFIPIGCDEEPPTQTQAEQYDPVAVDPPAPVTAGETPNAKDYVKDPDNLPEGTTFEFDDADFSTPGDKKTTITVTYPDKSTDTVEVTIPVKAKPTQAEQYDPVAVDAPKPVTTGETPDAKDYVKDADKLPEGTTFEFDDADFSTPGDKKTTITVTYPDKSTDTVEVTIPVKAKPTQAEQNDPVAVDNPAEITEGDTPDAKDYIKDADKLPEGTTFEFDDADFSTPGDKKTTITVKYPDKSTDTVEVTIPVKAKPTQAELHDPVAVAEPAPVTTGETPNAKDYVKDADKLPEGTTFEFADADFSTPGDKKTTITVTYPDKSTDTVEVTIPVKAKPTQAEQNDPVAVAEPAPVTTGETPDAKDYVKDADKLPDGTTFEFTDADFSAPGDKKTTITVTYPDKSTDTVEVTIPVKAKPTQAELHDPVAVDAPKPVTAGEEPEARGYVKDVDKLPEGTTFEFTPKPDFTKPGDKQITITVKYPDGSTDEVIVIISVKAKDKAPEPQGSSFKDLSSECRSSIIGGSIGGVLGLLIAIVSQLNIPGLSDGVKAANTQIQIALGIHNPARAENANNWVSIIGGIVGAMIFFTSAGVAIAKCKTESGSSD